MAEATAKNWKTTVTPVLITVVCYGLSYFGWWPSWFPPLPPIDQSIVPLLSVFGLGYMAKDHDVTGGTR